MGRDVRARHRVRRTGVTPLERKILARIGVIDDALLRRRFVRINEPAYDLNERQA